MSSANLVAAMTKEEKLSGIGNYNLWQTKIQFILNQHELLDTITTTMAEPELGERTVATFRREQEAYQAFIKKGSYCVLYFARLYAR